MAKHYHLSLSGETGPEWRIDMVEIIKRINQVKLGFRAIIF